VILRVLNFLVIGVLVLAAADVYRIKYDSTVQAEHLAKLRGEARRVREQIAALRAQWGELDNPARIEPIAKHFLNLRPVAAAQFDTLDHLPARPVQPVRPEEADPIGGIIEHLEDPAPITGSVHKKISHAAPPMNLTPVVSPVRSGATNR
jgi:cell division protein FtsL